MQSLGDGRKVKQHLEQRQRWVRPMDNKTTQVTWEKAGFALRRVRASSKQESAMYRNRSARTHAFRRLAFSPTTGANQNTIFAHNRPMSLGEERRTRIPVRRKTKNELTAPVSTPPPIPSRSNISFLIFPFLSHTCPYFFRLSLVSVYFHVILFYSLPLLSFPFVLHLL